MSKTRLTEYKKELKDKDCKALVKSRYVATVADALRRRRLAQPPSGG